MPLQAASKAAVLVSHASTGIADVRQAAKVTYPLFDILFLTITAVITGCEGWEEIEDFGNALLDWLQGYGNFENVKSLPLMERR